MPAQPLTPPRCWFFPHPGRRSHIHSEWISQISSISTRRTASMSPRAKKKSLRPKTTNPQKNEDSNHQLHSGIPGDLMASPHQFPHGCFRLGSASACPNPRRASFPMKWEEWEPSDVASPTGESSFNGSRNGPLPAGFDFRWSPQTIPGAPVWSPWKKISRWNSKTREPKSPGRPPSEPPENSQNSKSWDSIPD